MNLLGWNYEFKEVSEQEEARLLGRLMMLATIVMPFGKWKATEFGDIPLSYLDQTVSQMPDRWLTRRASEFVDLAADYIGVHGHAPRVPDHSFNSIWEHYSKAAARIRMNQPAD